jgi:uncharacterized membrane protein YedE/YeeE
MGRTLAGLAAGLLFGLGIVVSGMSDPAKVLAFLDLAGAWDPSLALVLAAAVGVTFVGYRLAWARGRPVLAADFDLPRPREVDARLVAGAVIFGLGWGLGGFCPGPALVALPQAALGTLVFVPAMLAGMALARRLARPAPSSESMIVLGGLNR